MGDGRGDETRERECDMKESKGQERENEKL